jgi:hypothetical protein
MKDFRLEGPEMKDFRPEGPGLRPEGLLAIGAAAGGADK